MTGNDGNCDRHPGGENRFFWNVDQLDSDWNSLRETDPLKGRVHVLQQISSGRILRITDSTGNAVHSPLDRRRSTHRYHCRRIANLGSQRNTPPRVITSRYPGFAAKWKVSLLPKRAAINIEHARQGPGYAPGGAVRTRADHALLHRMRNLLAIRIVLKI
jgi:hypothetical protein